MGNVEKSVLRFWLGATGAMFLALALHRMKRQVIDEQASAVYRIRQDWDDLRCDLLDAVKKD
jgi:hypothetical protein